MIGYVVFDMVKHAIEISQGWWVVSESIEMDKRELNLMFKLTLETLTLMSSLDKITTQKSYKMKNSLQPKHYFTLISPFNYMILDFHCFY